MVEKELFEVVVIDEHVQSWLKNLQIQLGLMEARSCPLPIDNHKRCPLGAETVLIVYNCLICGLHYKCNNIAFAECG